MMTTRARRAAFVAALTLTLGGARMAPAADCSALKPPLRVPKAVIRAW